MESDLLTVWCQTVALRNECQHLRILEEAEFQPPVGASAGQPKLPAQLLRKRPWRTPCSGKPSRLSFRRCFWQKRPRRRRISTWAKENQLAFVAAYPLVETSRIKGLLRWMWEDSSWRKARSWFQLHASFAGGPLCATPSYGPRATDARQLNFPDAGDKGPRVNTGPRELLGRILEVAKTQADAERGTTFSGG